MPGKFDDGYYSCEALHYHSLIIKIK